MEKEIKITLSEIGRYSQDAERRMEVNLTSAFRTIKKDISDIIQKLEDKLKSLEKKKVPSSASAKATSIPHRLENALSEASKEGEKVVSDLKKDATFFVEECRKVMGKVAGEVEKGSADTVAVTRKASEDLFHALDTMGKDALSKVEQVSSSIARHVEIDAGFVFHHGLQIAEGATIALVSPVLIACVAVSGLAIIGASHWQPKPIMA